MPISVDRIPSTIRQAVDLLADSLSVNEREYFRITPAETLVGDFGMALRQGWSLWEIDTPLQRHAIKHYAIAHADDASALTVHWARALILDEPFFSVDHCERYHTHWAKLGTTSMEAAGWKKG